MSVAMEAAAILEILLTVVFFGKTKSLTILNFLRKYYLKIT